MTPMVDLGFLLVTFFMMTTQFTPTDIVQIAIPSSTADIKLPESNTATILISKDGRVFFRMDGVKNLKSLGARLNAKYNLGLTDDDITEFSTQTGFGMPIAGLKQFLALSDTDQKNMSQPGIPMEPGQNELADWLIFGRIANTQARIVIKADKETPYYPTIKNVLDTLRDCNIYRFSLITDQEQTAS
jgi:biopolymer transport protein ExbD